MRRSLVYLLVGLALALGSPLGWLLLSGDVAHPITALAAQPGLYLYLALGTALAFAVFGLVLGRFSDRLAAQNTQLDALSRTDALTQLPNVRAFREALVRESTRTTRTGEPLSLVMVDLDHFKRVNDTHGHAVGDLVLAHAAKQLAGAVRAIDVVGRVGGEEFAILCPGADANEAASVAERARALLERTPVSVASGLIPVTASFGVATLHQSPDSLFPAADAALYEAKRTGRNRVAIEHG